MQNRDFKLKFLFWLIMAAVLVAYFARGLEWTEVKSSFRELDLGLAAASTLPFMLTYWVRALRWRAFLAPIGHPSIRNLFAATVIGFSSIFVLGRVGEVIRPVILSMRERLRPSATLASILIERLFDSVAVVLLFALDLTFFKQTDNHHQQVVMAQRIGFGLLIASGLLVAGLSLFRTHVKGVLGFLETRLAWLPTKIYRVLLNLLRHLADGLYVLHDVRGLVSTVGYTTLIWALVTLGFWLLMRAFGLFWSPLAVVFILGFALVGSLVPTPGGSAGAFHTATMFGLILLNVEQNKAASIAIAMHLVGFGTALIFGTYFLICDGISFKSLRTMMAEEMISDESTDRVVEEPRAPVIGVEP